jgi:2-polyprenyl-3-methyl-5-hydroxy-6-metoxy-1,4-benzoquinol methylase
VERLEERYRRHHREARSPDFVWARPERSASFREVVGGPGKRILDLGCRYGALTAFYADGNDVVGVDIDREALGVAEERLGIETLWADLDEPLEYEDESFDVVVLGEVLEHIREPSELVLEAIRVLRPGGTLVGSIPNAFRLKSRLLFLLGRHPEENPTHLHVFAPGDVRTLLSGLENVALRFLAGRFVPLNGRLFANVIFFSGTKPS